MAEDLFDFRIKGAESLAALGKTLRKVEGGNELRKELLRNLRAAGKPTADDIRANLRNGLPKRGGLAKKMGAAKVATRNKLSGDNAGMRIDVKHTDHDIVSVDKGRLRHPTFGHGPFVNQKVKPDLVTDAFDDNAPRMREAVLDAMDTVLDQINRS